MFVTDDGAETDLDLGHYERFIETRMQPVQQLHHRPHLPDACSRRSAAATTWARPVQVIPHITNEIQEYVKRGAGIGTHDAVDVAICEVGGTVGDIESLPFLEAMRQLALKQGPNNTRLRASDLPALHRNGGRAQDQAHPAHGAKAARNRHPARCAAVPRQRSVPADEEARRSPCSPTWPSGA